MRILIIEDEYKLAEVIKARLEKEKYTIDISEDGEEGLYKALSNIYDLIILDIMLPNINGIEILEKINNKIDSKIIMLTSKNEIEDKLTCFNKGANDYLTKPFHIDELIARVNKELRPQAKKENELLEVGNTKLNIKNSTIVCLKTNESVEIIGKEFLLLEYFMNNKNQIIEKEQIYNKVWGIDNEIESNNLEAYLSFLRRKLKIIGSNLNIKAIRGMGYKMEIKDE